MKYKTKLGILFSYFQVFMKTLLTPVIWHKTKSTYMHMRKGSWPKVLQKVLHIIDGNMQVSTLNIEVPISRVLHGYDGPQKLIGIGSVISLFSRVS